MSLDEKNNKDTENSRVSYSEYQDLTPIDHIENGGEYIAALNWAFQNKKIKNIALTGPYGAGKSSIIETFLAEDEKRVSEKGRAARNKAIRKTALNISMATFVRGHPEKTDGGGNKIDIGAEEVEEGILKQLFYKVEPSKIPQSRYRKLHLLDSTIAGDEKEFDSLNGDSSYDGEYYGGFDEIALDNNCSICGVTYAFDNPMEQEFEDERTLRRISFAVRDKIPYNLRTEEKHGDIVAAYETVYDFLVEHYGTPVYTGDRVLGLQTIKWDIPEQNLGVELNLLGETDYREQGSFEVVYFSTDGYREDWYLR